MLLDLGDGSKKEIILVKENALESISQEIKHYFKDSDIQLCGLTVTAEAETKSGPKYMLQRWSSKWKEHVDIISSEDIKNGDKLRVLPKSTVSPTVR